MDISATTPNGAFPYVIPPISNITPFTYRDGWTYLELLYALRNYVTKTIVADMNKNSADSAAAFQAGIANAEKVITDLSAHWDSQYANLAANFTAEVRALSEQAISDTVADTASTTHATILGLINTAINAAVSEQHVYADNGDTAVRVEFAAADQSVRADFAAADQSVRTDFAAADTQLRADLATKTALAEVTRIHPVGPLDAVFIGDSYFTGYQPSPTPYIKPIPDRVVDLLNAEGLQQWRLHSYAGNAGGYNSTYSGGDTSFTTQTTTALADTAITNCRLVVIGGGRNDNGQDDYTSAKSIYARVKAKWPAARIIVFPMWSREAFTRNARITFASIYKAAYESGCVADVNSLWVNALTDQSAWVDTIPHPTDAPAQNFANAIYSLYRGGNLPGRTTDLNMHSSSGITVGVATINQWTVSIMFQQNVGANFDGTYILGNIQYPVLAPGNVNQYMTGYSGNGSVTTLYTVGVNTNIFATNSGTAGLCGLTGAYPVGQ